MINKKSLKNSNKSGAGLKFPAGFLWGAATSAYQVEGEIENNDWAEAGRQGRVPKTGLASDHYHRYEDDFQMAKYLHHNAHRLSLEWSRIEPQAGKFSEETLEHYHQVLNFLKDNGFATFVTLHHFTNPLWFSSRGGWANPQASQYFGNYVAKVTQSLGHLVDYWVTVNEPCLYAGLSYGRGQWPPFHRSYLKAWRVYKLLLAAHNRAYEVIHQYFPKALVGFAQNIAYNHGGLAAKLSDYLEIDFPYRQTNNDFLGLNHYFHRKYRLGFRMEREGAQTDWKIFPIYPRAIYEVLRKLKKYNLPIYITENGLPDARDLKRESYIKSYLSEVHHAIRDGAQVRGYFHWSLLDNFEWAEGYKYRFGLIAVDFKTQKRTIRESAYAYSHICQDNGLPPLNLPLSKGEKERGL